MGDETHSGGRFPSTAWSMIAGLQDEGTARERGLASLARGYWKPIYSYLRRALRRSPQEAEDLTQGFLTWLLESPVFSAYDPGRGPFRPYLKTLLHNFARNQRRIERAQKRGGGEAAVPLDALSGDVVPDSDAESPEAAFDRAWVAELVSRATERVRLQLEREGKDQAFAIYQAYDHPEPGVLPTYDSVAEALGVKASSVRHALSKVRERLRTEIRLELRDTVRDAEQLESEWRELFLA